jgi:hypothetical protein
MIEAKGLGVSAALNILDASEILSCFESQEKADLDRIRACIDINELPSFALVQSICPGELLSFVASAFFCLSFGFVLVGANISHLISAVVTPAEKPQTPDHPTPKPRQPLLTVLTSAVKMKATATARSGRAARYTLANQASASSAAVWRRESAKRRAYTSFMPCLLLALSLLSGARPAALPAWATRSYTAPLFLSLCYVPSPPSPPLGSWAGPPTLACTGYWLLVARPKKPPRPPTEGVFSFQCNSQYNSQ